MKQLLLLFVVMATAVALAACGGGADAGPEKVTFDVTGKDEFAYEPSSLTASTGSEITINFKNDGVLNHNWMLISSRIVPTEAKVEDAIAGATSGEIGSGESKTFIFTAPPAGTYNFVCTVPGHAGGGMVGTLTVNP